jgi:ribosome-associated protein
MQNTESRTDRTPPSDGSLRVNARVSIPRAELRVHFARSSGPGGQNVNKTSTKVELRFALRTSPSLTDADRAWLEKKLASRLTSDGELLITSDRHRSQPENLRECRERLAALLRDSLERPKPRIKTRKTAASNRRRLDAKKRRSNVKQWRREAPE